MYVSKKDLDTISELCAMVDGAMESVDGLDNEGVPLIDYWNDFSDRTNKLQDKMKNQEFRQR